MRNKKKKSRRLALAACMVMAVLAAAPFFVNADTGQKNRIPKGVYAGELYIGEMTKEEAALRIREFVTGLLDKKITLLAGDAKLTATAGELGVSWDNQEMIEEAAGLGTTGNLIARYKELKDLEQKDKVYDIAYGIDRDAVRRLLERHKDTLNKEAVDSRLQRTDGVFEIILGSQGVEVDTEKSVKKLERFFRTEWNESDAAIELAVHITEPKGTEEELKKVKDLLGTYQTSYTSSNAGRRQNVENGASKINGAVVYPGEVFSVYEVTHPFEAENGYAIGGAYENGLVVESYGGGICQVSTTLYNAVIRAELEVVERFPHSMTVSYVEPSEDAAIAGTYKDLKFKNNTGAPVYLEGYAAKSVLHFNIYGEEIREQNRKVTFESEILQTTDPGIRFQAAGDKPVGYVGVEQTEHVGYKARLWKIVTVDGVEESREIFNTSAYNPSAKIISVGTASANPEAVAAISAAVATQDEGTIYAAAAQWNEIPPPPEQQPPPEGTQ